MVRTPAKIPIKSFLKKDYRSNLMEQGDIRRLLFNALLYLANSEGWKHRGLIQNIIVNELKINNLSELLVIEDELRQTILRYYYYFEYKDEAPWGILPRELIAEFNRRMETLNSKIRFTGSLGPTDICRSHKTMGDMYKLFLLDPRTFRNTRLVITNGSEEYRSYARIILEYIERKEPFTGSEENFNYFSTFISHMPHNNEIISFLEKEDTQEKWKAWKEKDNSPRMRIFKRL